MNYIYDIYLNLNKKLYDFYDWDKKDNILHVKKIPIFIIDSDNFKNIVAYDIKVSEDFIKIINKKIELWNLNKTINNCTLFSDYNNIIAVEFDSKGNSIKKSFLYIDDENDTLEDIEKKNLYKLDFKILKHNSYKLKTRTQIKKDTFINNELKKINNNKLKYIYFECFGIKNTNNRDIIKKLKKIKYASKKYNNLYDILKLTSKPVE